jgi:hypothetical protein
VEVAMTCNSCETTFQGSQTLVVSVTKSGSSAVLSVGNQGRNIALISRILLCMDDKAGFQFLDGARRWEAAVMTLHFLGGKFLWFLGRIKCVCF